MPPTEPVPSIEDLKIEPTPSVEGGKIEPTPSGDDVKVEPTPPVEGVKAKPTPSDDDVKAKTTPSDDDGKIKPTPSVDDMEFDDIPIPTIDEIERKGYRHRHPSGVPNITIYKLKYLVKKSQPGTEDRLYTEIETLNFLNEHTTIPVPKVLAILKADDGITFYLVMNYIPALTLEQEWPKFNDAEKLEVTLELGKHLRQLHRLIPPSPSYFGGLHGGGLPDDIFSIPSVGQGLMRLHHPGLTPKLGYVPEKIESGFRWKGVLMARKHNSTGPFASEEEWVSSLWARCCEWNIRSQGAMLKMMRGKFCGHRSVFSHGDLQQKNILVQRIPENERTNEFDSKFRVTLIDWEAAGFYPEFWDFCLSAFLGWDNGWIDYVDRAMKPYWDEYPMFSCLYAYLSPLHLYTDWN